MSFQASTNDLSLRFRGTSATDETSAGARKCRAQGKLQPTRFELALELPNKLRLGRWRLLLCLTVVLVQPSGSNQAEHMLQAEFVRMANDSVNTVEDYFQYKPSLALNIVALILFTGITIIISVQNVRYKSKFMWIVAFTGCLEVAGYISHMIGTETVNPQSYEAYLVFTILAPNFLALANYIAVGKVAQHLALSGRFLNTKSIAIGFFLVDLICIAIQGGGSAIVSG